MTKPTRINKFKIQRSSLLDHIYTNDCKYDLTPGILVSDTSDHFPVFLQVNMQHHNNDNEIQKCHDMKKFDESHFLNDLENKMKDVSEQVNNDDENYDINSAFNSFAKTVKNTVDLHAPIRNRTRNEKRKLGKTWLTKGILTSIKNRKKMFTKMNKNPSLEANYIRYRNMVKQLIRNSKRNENKKKILLSNKKSKTMWEIINNSLNRKKKTNKPKIKKIKISATEVTTDNSKISNKFNEYFTNIGKSMAEKIPQIPNVIHSPRVSNSIMFSETTSQEIELIISKLNSKKAIINEDIPTRFLKISSPVVSHLLSHFFNSCLKRGIYPDILKLAQVIPIHKANAKDICSNYRPISLLSQYNKIFEKIIHTRLYDFLEKYKILSQHQYGFRKNTSTALATYDLIENLIKSKDNNKIACAVFLDLSKAFDTVDRNILIKKLEHNGIRGKPLKLLENYLTNRKQYIYFCKWNKIFGVND